jgi:replication-associated recombination protein RarA
MGLNFPESLELKYQPKRVEDFLGMVGPKAVLTAFLQNPYPSSWLFVGASGKGKSTMGLAMAEQIPAELKHVPSKDCDLKMVEDIAYHCHYMPWAPKRFHLVLVDEANEMTSAARDAWLSKLDATARIPNTIIVFTTNETYNLPARFLSRCRVLRFDEEPTADEIRAFLQKVWHLENVRNLPEPNYDALVKEAGGNYRDCMMKLELALLGLRASEPIAEPSPVVKPTSELSKSTCEDCGSEIPSRWRCCEACLEKRRIQRLYTKPRCGGIQSAQKGA